MPFDTSCRTVSAAARPARERPGRQAFRAAGRLAGPLPTAIIPPPPAASRGRGCPYFCRGSSGPVMDRAPAHRQRMPRRSRMRPPVLIMTVASPDSCAHVSELSSRGIGRASSRNGAFTGCRRACFLMQQESRSELFYFTESARKPAAV